MHETFPLTRNIEQPTLNLNPIVHISRWILLVLFRTRQGIKMLEKYMLHFRKVYVTFKSICSKHHLKALTWTHREIMSAKCDNDLAGYSPFRDGSTILDKASMSWSWGIAHLTRNCSARLRVLVIISRKIKVSSKNKHYIIAQYGSAWLFVPVMRLSAR